MTVSDEQKAHVKLVCAVAFVDGHLDDVETAWTHTVAKNMGLTFNEFKDSISMSAEEAMAALPESKADRAVLLADCICCALIDGHMDDSETKFCGTLAAVLGLSNEDIKTIVEMIHEGKITISEIRTAFA
jgi:tellurite resistance protein